MANALFSIQSLSRLVDLQNQMLDEFLSSELAQILCDNQGNHCQLNRSAELIFSPESINHISELFPDIASFGTQLDGEYAAVTDKHYYLEFKEFNDGRCLIRIDTDEDSEWRQFSLYNQTLHQMYLELSQFENEMLLYKRIIEHALEYLDFDRMVAIRSL